GRTEVELGDVRRAALLALPHRRRRGPFERPGIDPEALERALSEDPEPDLNPEPPGGGGGRDRSDDGTGDPAPVAGNGRVSQPQASARPGSGPAESAAAAEAGETGGAGAQETVLRPGVPFTPLLLEAPPQNRAGAGRQGRRSRGAGSDGRGRPVGDAPGGEATGAVSLVGTLRAAAPFQAARGRRGPGLVLQRGDIRRSVTEDREGNLVLFVVDASGSMAARRRMTAVKGAVLSLLLDAYQRRDRVGVVTFGGTGGAAATLSLPPTSSVEEAAARLAELPVGGRTPLADGLMLAASVIASEAARDPARTPLLVVVSDGRANVSGAGGNPVGDALRAAAALGARGVAGVVVDSEEGPVRLGIAARLAEALGSPCLRLEELASASLTRAVRATTGPDRGPRRRGAA
ncbi:MAG TPA: VWA domain-containing protein, partial [Actinomycetota bacterium]